MPPTVRSSDLICGGNSPRGLTNCERVADGVDDGDGDEESVILMGLSIHIADIQLGAAYNSVGIGANALQEEFSVSDTLNQLVPWKIEEYTAHDDWPSRPTYTSHVARGPRDGVDLAIIVPLCFGLSMLSCGTRKYPGKATLEKDTYGAGEPSRAGTT